MSDVPAAPLLLLYSRSPGSLPGKFLFCSFVKILEGHTVLTVTEVPMSPLNGVHSVPLYI